VDHTVYDNLNIFNRILHKTLKAIGDISNNPFLKDRINRLLFSFPELDDIKIGEATFSKLIFDRKTERYRDAMQLSKMILLNYHPDISGGNENVFAILFDMNRLWEEFVYRRLKREESKYYIKILPQQSENFWKPSHSIYSKTIRPDIVVQFKYKGKEKTIVIDTKWKILKNLIPSDEDLKQMFVYNLFWKCDKSILLYPSSSPASGSGDYHYKVNYSSNNTCAIETITVLEESNSQLDKTLGFSILNTILGSEVLDELKK
jgi:5-methylcytosine-specific restriction enzyme subunit McrC